MKIKTLIDLKLLKFILVGIVNTIFGAGIMFLLYNCFNFSYWTSSICNYVFGGILSFFLNKFFTFKDNKKSVKQFLLFALTVLFCYLVSYIAAKKIIYLILSPYSVKIKDNVSMMAAMILYTALNYIIQRFIIFKGTQND